MKLKVRKKEFLSILEELSRVINPNSPLVSLQGISIEALENKIIFKSSNGNISIKKEIDVDTDINVLTPGNILVPGKLFKEIIKKQSEDIEINREKNEIIIRSNGSEAFLNLLNFNDFPTISFDKVGEEFEIEVSKFKDIIKNVSYAAAENDNRLILNGVNIKASNSKLAVSATNSFRFATEVLSIDSDIEFNITILSSSLKILLSSLESGLLRISINDSKIISEVDNMIIVSNLIDGIYPELEKLIPHDFKTIIKTSTNEINKLIDKVLVMSTEKKRVTKLTIDNNEIILEMKRQEIGELIAKSNKFKLEGENIAIPFDIGFFKEAISKVSGDIEIKFNAPNKAFIIKSTNKRNLIQFILPHRSY